MNVSEMSDGVKIALTLVLICILIAIVFGIVRFVKGTTDEGTANLENSVLAMSETEFDQYNNTTRSGTQVASLVQLYANRDMAVVVETKRGTVINYGRTLEGVTIPGGSFSKQTEQPDATGTPVVTVAAGLGTDVQYNSNLVNLNNSSHADFVRATAKFKSFLIKDEGDQVIGVYFRQEQ